MLRGGNVYWDIAKVQVKSELRRTEIEKKSSFRPCGASGKGLASLKSQTCCFLVEKEAFKAQEGHADVWQAVKKPDSLIKSSRFSFLSLWLTFHRSSLIITVCVRPNKPLLFISIHSFLSFFYFVAVYDAAWQLCFKQLLNRNISLRPFIFIGTGHAHVLIAVLIYKLARH